MSIAVICQDIMATSIAIHGDQDLSPNLWSSGNLGPQNPQTLPIKG